MRKLLGGRDDDGLDFRRQFPVRVCYGTLRLEINHIPDTAHDVPDAELVTSIYGEVVILDDAHPLKPLDCLTDDVDTLVHIEEAAFVLIDSDSHDHFVEHCQCPFQYIQMSCSKRVERPREQCLGFHNH